MAEGKALVVGVSVADEDDVIRMSGVFKEAADIGDLLPFTLSKTSAA